MTQENKTRVKSVASALYPEQVKIVEDYAQYTGLGNFSAALRMIINEWAREHNFQNGNKQQEQVT